MEYGDQQAMMTMNRAAYGDIPAAMMTGAGTVYGGASMGMSNMMTDIGRSVMPIGYTPPARVHVGYYGMYQQHTGLMRGLAGMMGMESVPRGTNAMEHAIMTAGDMGERVGGGIVGATTTLAAVGLASTGIASAAGAGIGGAVGSAVGLGGLGAIAGGLILPYAAAIGAAGAVNNAIGQRRDIQNFLESSSFRFVGAGSAMADPRLGAGMSRAARSQTAEFIRSQDIKDPFLNTEELTDIMRQGTQLGLFNGTKDMGDFQKKFKDITEAVKTVTRTLHQTLEEGMKTIKDLKGIGVDPSQVKAVVSSADMLGRVAGRTGSEMLSLGLQGADMFRGTGVNMGIGMQATMMNMASVRASRDAGTLAQEAIVQAGGEEALAMRMTASGLAFGQSSMGRGFGAAFFGGGGFNSNSFMANMMAGGGNFVGTAQTAAGNLGSPSALIAYQANQEKFMSDMGAKFGGRGLQIAQTASAMSYASYIAGATGASTEDAFRLGLKEQGLSKAEIDARIGEIRGAGSNFTAAQRSAGITRDREVVEEASRNFVFNRISAQVGDKAKEVVDIAAKPLNRFIDATAESFIRFKEEQLYGVQRASTEGVDTTTNDFRRMSRVGRGVVDLDQGAAFATSSGENILKTLKNNPKLADMLGIKTRSVAEGALTDNDIVLDRSVGGQATVVSKAEFAAAQKQANVLGMSEGQAKAMQEAGMLKDVKGGSLVDAVAGGKIAAVSDYTSLAKAMFGKSKLSAEEHAKLINEVKGTSLEGLVGEARNAAGVLSQGSSSVQLAELKNAREGLAETQGKLEEKAGFKISSGAMSMLAKAAMIEKTDPEAAKRMRAEAAIEQSRSGGTSISVARQGFMNVAKDRTSLLQVAEDIGTIQEIQDQRGSNLLSRVVESELYSEKGSKLSQTQRDKLGVVAVAMGKGDLNSFLSEIRSKDAEGLQKLDVGQTLLKQAGTLEAIKSFKEGPDRGNQATAFQETLKGQGISDPKQLARLTRTFAEKGSAAAAQQAFDEFQSNMAGTGGAFAAGGANADGGTAPTAEQTLITQTNINLQTLAVMESLAARLGAGKR